MKFNKWTIGLAAAGIVTLPSLTQAQPIAVVSAVATTTLSGYVDTSAHWNLGHTFNNSLGVEGTPGYSFNSGKSDGFNLNVVDLALDKPLDETPWAAGYHAELWFGPDANALNTGSSYGGGHASDWAIRQAYVTLRTPVGNGIDWKMGLFDSPLGYESTSSINNPNYTRSYGYTIEPTELTGLIGTYKFCDMASLTAGVVNTIDAVINERDQFGAKEDTKAYLASLALTAPQDWGWLAGSSLNVGFIHGFSGSSSGNGNVTHLYAGATLSTPVTGLKAGAAFDYRHDHDVVGQSGDVWIYGLYASYQATEKLGLNVRGEYIQNSDTLSFGHTLGSSIPRRGYELTFTAQYDLWKNVLSRVELRWDHDEQESFGANGDRKNALVLAANVAYKF